MTPTPEQWTELSRRLGRSVRLLGRLRDRLQRIDMAGSDRYRILTARAYDVVHALSVHTHYMSCEHGVCGRGYRRLQDEDARLWLGDGI